VRRYFAGIRLRVVGEKEDFILSLVQFPNPVDYKNNEFSSCILFVHAQIIDFSVVWKI